MNEQNILIVRCGEVALKGMNKPYFERMLVDRIRAALRRFHGVDVQRHEGLIFIRADKSQDIEQIIRATARVFGVASISKAVEAPSELDAAGEAAVAYMLELIEKLTPEVFAEIKKDDKIMCANVDLYSGLVYKTLGIPQDLYTPLFATARMVGWCAHRIEELTSGGKIMRPAYKSVAPQRKYVPLMDRVEE